MTKVIVIGIDGCEPTLVERWKDSLPNLKKIIEGGIHGTLKSTIPPTSSPAWISLYTGKNPAKYGIFGFVNVSRDLTTNIVDSTLCDSLSIYEILSKFGKRVCVLNVPVTYPPRNVNGYMVAGYPAPLSKDDYTFPRHLYKELDKIVGNYQTDVIYSSPEDAGEEMFLSEMSEVHHKVKTIAKYLHGKEDWDFFMVVFREIDYVQHFFWKYMNQNDHTKIHQKYENVTKEWYVRIDNTVGEILDELDDDTYVIIVSDHGCQAVKYTIHINEWLMKHEWLNFLNEKKGIPVSFFMALRKLVVKYANPYLIKKLISIIPHWLLTKATLSRRIDQGINYFFTRINWSRTKIYALSGTNAALYVNLKRENVLGIVTPGKEYDVLISKVIESLKGISQEVNKLIIVRIYKKEDIYWGRYSHMAPDLTVDFFIEDTKCFVDSETGHGKILDEIEAYVNGIHSNEGIWIATGPGVQKDMKINANIVDIAPTILYLLDIPIPDDMDGKVILQGLTLTKTPRYQESKTGKIKEISPYSSQDEKEIMKRLKALGYIS